MALKAFKYRLYPNVKQSILLSKTMGCVRFFWNEQVSAFNSFEKESEGKPVFKTSTQLRQDNVWMKEVSAAAVQQKEIDFKEFRSQFFSKSRKKKVGRPKFKKRSDRQSFRLPNQKFSVFQSVLRLEKIGRVKYIQDRPLPQNHKTISVTISKEPCGHYYASVLVEAEVSPLPKTGNSVGIDVGVKTFAVLSDGSVIDNPKFFRESQTRLRKAQRNLSRKKKGSRRRWKAKLKVARLHKKISNQRNHFLQTVTTDIVQKYDTICIEDLNMAGMVRNRKLAKSISDASFASFFSMLAYKCDWYGKQLVKVGRFEPTSKTCSLCGSVKKTLLLSERIYDCENCGISIDRDENAAINILALGVNSAQRTQTERKTASAADRDEAFRIKQNEIPQNL
ncbi:MAG: RNA-guided endonuclease InsQ/TnpB family protein [Lactococcus garvieae]